jgi:hypothetical protein
MTDIFEMTWDTLKKNAFSSTDRGYYNDPQQQAEMTPEQRAAAKGADTDGMAEFLDQLPDDDYDDMSREQLIALVRRMQEAR